MKHLQNQPGIYCLNEGWRFMEDNSSVLPDSGNRSAIYDFAKGGAAGGPAGPMFDDSHWEQVHLPHDWVAKKNFDEKECLNFAYKNRGEGWYRLKFKLEEADREKQILLEFEGMSRDAEIYINGMLMKRNFSGYNSFPVDITDMAHFGIVPNVLAVHIDASKWEGWWYEGAGIYRHVWLVKKSPVHIAYNGTWVKPQKREGDRWSIELETCLENSFEFDSDVTVRTTIAAPDKASVAAAETASEVKGFGTSSVKQILEVENPGLWSLQSPQLYEALTEVVCGGQVVDYLRTPFGFRTIQMDADTGFWLNGENIKLKGFCNHQDHAGVGVAVPYAIKEYRIQLLKSIGANAYRCAHNPDPEILEICDRMGMLVMNENRTFSSEATNLLEIKELVRNSRNHPSVILYSVFNEEPLQGTGKGRRIAGRLQAAVKSMDDTRPVLGAFNGGFMEEGGAATILDVTGINYAVGSYDAFHAKYPHTPALGSETASAFMVRGEYETDMEKHVISNFDDRKADWGSTVRDAWEAINERHFMAGAFVWTGFDYGGEPTPFQWPSVSTFFGTFDRCGFRKDACYLYEAFWKQESIVHLLPHWTLQVEPGTPVYVMAFTNCQEVELILNGKVLFRKQCDKYRQVSFEVPYEPGVLKAVGYRDGKRVAEDKQVTAKNVGSLKLEVSKKSMTADGRDAVAVNVYAVDKYGILVPDADNLISFQVEGGGKILGVGNGNPNSHEPEIASYRRLFHGCAQVIVGNAGEEDVKVTAYGEGIEPAAVKIPVVWEETIPYLKAVREQSGRISPTG